MDDGKVTAIKLSKILILILISWSIVSPCPVFSANTQAGDHFDTLRLQELILKGKRYDAAAYLINFLNGKQEDDPVVTAGRWLEAAIFSAWADSLITSRIAYNNYLKHAGRNSADSVTRANDLLYQSLVLASQGSNNQAADSLMASMVIRPAPGTINRFLLADSYGKLARLYKRTEDLSESVRNFDRSININRQLRRDSVLAEDLSDLSSVLSKINPSDNRAESVLSESLTIYKRLDDQLSQAQVLHEYGVLYSRRKDFQESLKYFKRSLNSKLTIAGLDKQELVVVNNSIGHCFLDLKNIDSARCYFLKAIDYAIESGQNPAPYYTNLGAIYGNQEDYSRALEYFQHAIFWLDKTTSLTDFSINPKINKVTPRIADFIAFKGHTFHRRYHQLHNPADLVDGLNTFLVALEMMDTLRFMYSFDSKPYLSSEAKIHYFNALDMALDLYSITGQKKYLEQGFQLSERNKSAILNEFLRTNQAREYMGNVAPWIRKEDSIKQLINKLESKVIISGTLTNSEADSTNQVKIAISRLTDELLNIGIKAKHENPEYFRLVYSSNAYLPGVIQKLINPGEALIDYTVVNDSRLNLDYMIAIVLTRDTLYTFRDTLPSDFRKDINAFRATITSYVDAKVFQDFSRLSNLMYRYFVAPVEKFKGINQLIILPDEELGFLPFEVFVSDTLKPKGSDFRKLSYLNRQYQISYISSHEQLFQFRNNPRKHSPSSVYAFAPFVSKGVKIDTLNLLSLENSGNEVKYISKYFRTKVYKNKSAGEQTLLRAFRKESVISLSTHGIMNSNKPMQSRLLLNPSEPDGSLYLFEMMSIKIKSSLVILNACNTGMGKLQVGEGIMSMARAFQFAGVPSVITTLWPIDDKSSATVMKYFFANLNNGMNQREALMKARNSYIDQSSKANGAPYFWAGQVIIGDPGFLYIHHRINPLFLMLSLLMVVLVIATFVIIYKKVRH